MISQSILVAIILLLATEIKSAILPKADCPTSCGNLTIPFPFGTTSDCYLDDSFLITCNHSYNPPKPFLNLGNTQVLEISLDGLMQVASPVASDCYDDSGAQINGTTPELISSKFPISSTRNKFTAVGCDTYALIKGSKEWKQMSAGCVSWCDSIDSAVNGTCSGIGCCQTSIPKGVKDYFVDIRSFRNHTRVNNFNRCGYAFVVEAEAFEFSTSDIKDLRNRKSVPVVLDWSVGNLTCEEAWRNRSSYACKALHSECSDLTNGFGYRCNCLTGFQGNPYLIDGCQDIDECTTLKPCEGTCTNLPGNYSCSCPNEFEGDGMKNGTGCYFTSCHSASRKTNTSTLFCIVFGFMVSAVGGCWIFWRRKEKKVIKLRQNLFNRNGGRLLLNMLSSERTVAIFTAEDLKRATDNYDENNILRSEENLNNTYYKGILPDGENQLQVTVMKCGALDGSYVEHFISKLVTLSRIQHKNVVKLIGCCLETQVPLLVYESINNKTLHDYIHDDDSARSLSWDIRMRIAAKTAGALACLHSESAVPIIHGNLNSSTITLDHDFTVKVHDFTLTCLELSDVRLYVGAPGYLDPDYLTTGRLSVKSDVYSFGVVLAELLTGKKVISLERPSGEEHLSKYFVSLPGGDDLLSILDHRLVAEGNIEQLTQVAKLAQRCLSNSSAQRPTMEEVATALQLQMPMSLDQTQVHSNQMQNRFCQFRTTNNRLDESEVLVIMAGSDTPTFVATPQRAGPSSDMSPGKRYVSESSGTKSAGKLSGKNQPINRRKIPSEVGSSKSP
ncbi:Serine/threonine protein kinase [Handroanthus impetiginosus]|uniref:Serine/threonine protein kinase n=1 Tax=Handroanthus impetiginosus TaxID=429701 RepID=A0A2G9HD64_9LAMI|nr:Serine/threonine protein kinase [Handroanthus impetiginosus]